MSRPWRRILVSVCAAGVSAVAAPPAAISYRGSPVDIDRIAYVFQSSIVPIYVGTIFKGTGFVVAAESGYILTAAHVVDTPVAQEQGISVAFNEETPPAKRLKASLIQSLGADIDLALIRVTPEDALAGVRSIGVSFQAPTFGDKLFTAGYAPLDRHLIWRIDKASRSTGDAAKLLVTTEVWEGNSGSPLFNDHGCVCGVCVTEITGGRVAAGYMPILDAADLLDRLPLRGKMAEIDQKLRAEKLQPHELDKVLIGELDNPSNSDLYAWGNAIVAHIKDYAKFASQFDGEIYPALDDRGLAYVTRKIARAEWHRAPLTKGFGEGKPVTYGNEMELSRASRQIAESEFALGRLGQALEDAREAARWAGSHGEEKSQSLLLLGRIELAAGNIAGAREEVNLLLKQPVLPDAIKADGWALAGAVMDQAGESEAASKFYRDAAQLFGAGSAYHRAGQMWSAAANVNVRAGRVAEAETGLHQAVESFQKAGDVPGQNEALYCLAQVQSLMENKEALAQTLTDYLQVDPQGIHSTEVAGALKRLREHTLSSAVTPPVATLPAPPPPPPIRAPATGH